MVENEVQTVSSKLGAFIEKNKKAFITVLILLICLLVGFIVGVVIADNSKAKALQALDEITFELTDNSSTLDESEQAVRIQTAIEKASAYVNKGGIVGARANMLCADITFQQGKYEESASYWQKVAEKSKKSYLAPLAYFNLAVCQENLGKTDDAAENYKLAADNEDFVMRPHAMFSYARIIESKGDYEQAAKAYNEINDNFSSDSWANLAKSRLIALKNEGKIH